MPIQANATNTVALWPGQFTSIAAYWEDLKHNLRLIIPIGIAALLGGLAGGIVLLRTGQTTFMRLVPWLLLTAALLFAASTPVSRWIQKRSRGRSERESNPSMAPLSIGIAIVCFYIGYFGAGAGFLIMSLLALLGVENINQINALKVVTTCLANGIAVVTFIVEKQVAWRFCLAMMLTAAAGGYLGARYSRRLDPRLMRSIVVVIGLGMAAYFFWRSP